MAQPVAPYDYVNQALTVMQENALCADHIGDWKKYRQVMLARASNVKSVQDSHPIIREILRDLRDSHSFFVTPNGRVQTYNHSELPVPTAQMLGDIGYLKIPYYLATKKLSYEDFVDHVQTLIAQLDKKTTCGWVVDLRENCGGDMWPMIAGLGPLIGQGILGSFKYSKGPNKGNIPWSYRNGASLWNDKEVCARGNCLPHQLAKPNMRIAILTSKQTASSGEAVLISFMGRPNTFSIGTETAGLSTANSPFDLFDGSKLYLTTGVFADRTGKSYGVPIVPDVIINSRTAPTKPETDPVLTAALNRLRMTTT